MLKKKCATPIDRSQPLINEFFKSTSGKKINCGIKVEKPANRCKPARELPRLNQGQRNGAKTPLRSEKKKTCQSWSSEKQTAVQTHETTSIASTSSSSVSKQSFSNKSANDAESESTEIQIISSGNSSPKKTIKSFVEKCNSPASTSSSTPKGFSLKRRKSNFPGAQSPPKKALFSTDNVNSNPEATEISVASSSLPTIEPPSGFQDDFPDNFDPDIVELKVESRHKTFTQKLSEKFKKSSSNGDERVSPEKEKSAGTEDEVVEESMQAKRKEVREGGFLSPKKTAPKTGNPTTSTSPRWKVAVTITTPNRSMTSLSSDWSKTLSDLEKPPKPSGSDINKTPKGNFATPSIPSNDDRDEYLSRKNGVSTTKNSHRRALFSSTTTPKKVSSALDDCASSLSETNAVVSVDDCAANSSETNAESDVVNSINGRKSPSPNVAPQRNRSINLPTIRHDTVISPKRKLVTEDCDIPKKNKGSPHSPTIPSGFPNSPTKPNESSNASMRSTKAHEPLDMSRKTTLLSNSSTNTNEPSDSPIQSSEPEKPSEPRSSSSPTKANVLSASPSKSPTKSPRSSFSPRVKRSPQNTKKDLVDMDTAIRVIEILNQAKQGVIPLNNFDLDAIYAKNSFELEYGSLRTDAAIKYEVNDVRLPRDWDANHFFMALANVFSEPMNCGYFDHNELDFVFSAMTLSPNAQALFAKMIKRRRGWHKVSAIEYPKIDPDLKPVFRELVAKGFLDGDYENEELLQLLNILSAGELKTLCQSMKVNHKGTKTNLIAGLVKWSNSKRSLFAGMKAPCSVLKNKVTSLLESCIRVPKRVDNLLERIFILLIPTQTPGDSMVDIFNMLREIHMGEKTFPPTPQVRFPIFRDRLHLIRYAEARSAWNQIIKATEDRKWTQVRTLGQLAYDRLEPHFVSNNSGDENDMSTLPSYVKCFDANYAWSKVLWKSVDAYKKKESKSGVAEPADFETAVKFLKALISQKNTMPGNRIPWYSELALIEMSHRKDLEASANVTIEALKRGKLSEVDVAELLDRAQKLLKRRTGISAKTKERINETVQLTKQNIVVSTSEPKINEIEARMVERNVTGSKSHWEVKCGNDIEIMTVEQVALRHYFDKGFNGGLHCEGALPVTLFATLFWNEIYATSVPGAFLSPYQPAPVDLYTSHFLENRRKDIEIKFGIFRKLSPQTLSEIMYEDYMKCRHYESLMVGNLFRNADDFKDLIECLGIEAVCGICERLASNYKQWKSGFPDLVLWNSATKKCKIVEVKGPGDSLSTKQRLWIQYLESLGVAVEVCAVSRTTKGS